MKVRFFGVGNDIVYSSGYANAILKGDQALLLKKKQSACFVGCIVGNSNLSAVLQLLEIGDALGVDAHGLKMNCGYGNKVSALFLVEVLQVGAMLEVVCVNVAVLGYIIGLNVVGEFLYFERIAFLLKDGGNGVVQDFCMGGGNSATVIFLSSELLLFEEEQPVRASAASARAAIPAKRAIAAFFVVRE